MAPTKSNPPWPLDRRGRGRPKKMKICGVCGKPFATADFIRHLKDPACYPEVRQ